MANTKLESIALIALSLAQQQGLVHPLYVPDICENLTLEASTLTNSHGSSCVSRLTYFRNNSLSLLVLGAGVSLEIS